MKHSVGPRLPLLMVSMAACFSTTSVVAGSQASINGANFKAVDSPITIIQDGFSNSVGIVDEGLVADSAVKQTGFYNRTAILQFGNDKLAILSQPGRFNRAMIVQVAASDQDFQTVDSVQGARTLASTNYLFSLQTVVNDANPIAQQFSLLSFDQAKTVATNFLFAPELSRVNTAMLEDITRHFTSLLENRLAQGRVGSCASDRDAGPSAKRDPACSSSPFFAALSYGNTERDAALGVLGYEQEIRSATLGADFQLNPVSRVGVAFNLEESDGDLQGLGDVTTTGYQIGGFGSFSHANYYLDLIATLGQVNFTSERFAGLTKVRSDVDGWSYAGRLQGGYFFGQDKFRFGPVLGAGYSKGTVDAYWEKGHVLLTQRIEEQESERFVASVGAAFDRRDQIGGLPLHSYLKLELERDFGIGREELVESRFAFSPDFVVFTPLDDVAEDTYGRISGGLSLAINRQATVSLAGMTLLGADRLDTFDLYGELSVAF